MRDTRLITRTCEKLSTKKSTVPIAAPIPPPSCEPERGNASGGRACSRRLPTERDRKTRNFCASDRRDDLMAHQEAERPSRRSAPNWTPAERIPPVARLGQNDLVVELFLGLATLLGRWSSWGNQLLGSPLPSEVGVLRARKPSCEPSSFPDGRSSSDPTHHALPDGRSSERHQDVNSANTRSWRQVLGSESDSLHSKSRHLLCAKGLVLSLPRRPPVPWCRRRQCSRSGSGDSRQAIFRRRRHLRTSPQDGVPPLRLQHPRG